MSAALEHVRVWAATQAARMTVETRPPDWTAVTSVHRAAPEAARAEYERVGRCDAFTSAQAFSGRPVDRGDARMVDDPPPQEWSWLHVELALSRFGPEHRSALWSVYVVQRQNLPAETLRRAAQVVREVEASLEGARGRTIAEAAIDAVRRVREIRARYERERRARMKEGA